jgi:hypothetical protein
MRKVTYIVLIALALLSMHIAATHLWYTYVIRCDGFITAKFDGWYLDRDGLIPVVAMKYYIHKGSGESSYDHVFVFPWIYSSAKGFTVFG